MKGRPYLGAKALVLTLLILAAALLIAGLWKDLLVLQIGSPKILFPVSEGDVFVRIYTHSMYQTPVSEKFRVEDAQFRLFHVMTQSDAVLAYLGVEGKNEPNVDGTFREFTIPAASIGNHCLRVHDQDIPLVTCADPEGKISVKLLRVPLLVYFTRLIWR